MAESPLRTELALDGGLRLLRFQGLEAFLALEDVWRRTSAASAADPLCNDFDWLVAHARAFTDPASISGFEVRAADGRTIGAFAVQPEARRGLGALPRFVLLGDGSHDSDYLEPLSVAGQETRVAIAVLAAMERERRFGALVLSNLCASSPFVVALRATLAQRGRFVQTHPFTAGVAELAESADDYLAGLKSRMRSKVRQAMRRADAAHSEIEWLEDAGDLGSWNEGLFRLHGLRWQAKGQPGSFADPRRRAFYSELLPRFLERGQLAYSRLVRQGTPVAYQLGFVIGPRYYQLQEGYDPELETERPGVALRALAMGELIERGARVYDFLGGFTQHKRDWGAVERPGVTLAFATGSLRGRAAYWARSVRKAVAN